MPIVPFSVKSQVLGTADHCIWTPNGQAIRLSVTNYPAHLPSTAQIRKEPSSSHESSDVSTITRNPQTCCLTVPMTSVLNCFVFLKMKELKVLSPYNLPALPSI